MKKSPYSTRRPQVAMALVEIMFGMFIFILLAFVIASFAIDSLRSMAWSINKSDMTADIRLFSMTFEADAYRSSDAILYLSETASDLDNPDDRLTTGESGNCLLFIRTEELPNTNDFRRYYSSIVMYTQVTTSESASALARSEVTFNNISSLPVGGASGTETFENFLANNATNPLGNLTANTNQRILLEFAEPVTGTNSFFRMIDIGSYTASGEITHTYGSESLVNIFNIAISTKG